MIGKDTENISHLIKGKVCRTQSCQLICLFHKVRFPPGDLLRLDCCGVRHDMRFVAFNTGVIRSFG